jgi:hypothetical protein
VIAAPHSSRTAGRVALANLVRREEAAADASFIPEPQSLKEVG